MFNSASRFLLTPEVFATDNTLRLAATAAGGLNIDSGLGGSFSIRFDSRQPDGTLKFIRPAITDWPEETYTFSPTEAARNIYILHAPYAWGKTQPYPIATVVPIRLDSVRAAARLVSFVMNQPSAVTAIHVLSSCGSLRCTRYEILADGWEYSTAAREFVAAAIADMKRYAHLSRHPVAFISCTTEEMETARLNATVAPFSFEELVYAHRYTAC